MQALGTVFNAAVSLLLLMFLARVLGPAEFGRFAALLGFATLALIAIEGGWPTLLYRESVPGSGRDESHASRLARHALAHAASAGLLLLASALLVGQAALAAAACCMTTIAVMNLVSARLRGAGRFAAEAAWQATGRIVSALAIVASVSLWSASSTAVFLAWAASLLVVLGIAARRRIAPPSVRGIGATYALALPFVALEGLSALLFKSDVALFGLFGPTAGDLSDYAVCTRFNEAALLLAAAFGNVLLRAARQRAGDGAALARFAWRTLAAASAAGCLLWAGAMATGERLVPLVFGSPYDGTLLAWTASALPFALPAWLAVPILVASGSERSALLALSAASLALPLLIGAGAARAGAQGAALGFALSQALLCAGLCAGLARRPAS